MFVSLDAFRSDLTLFAKWPRRSLAAGLLAGCVMMVAGCQSYNPNLGAQSIQSSTITLLTPAAKAVNSGEFTLTVRGAGFVAGSVVQWDGSDRPSTVVNLNEITASIGASDIATAGTYQIRVKTPGEEDGNNFSNIRPFVVCDGPCPQSSAAASTRDVADTLAGDSYAPAISADRRYVAFAAVSEDPSTNAGTGPRNVYLRDTCEGGPQGCEPSTLLISSAWQGGAANGDSRAPSISAGGRFVAFVSDASDLVERDTNRFADVFLRDTCLGAPEGCLPATSRISIGADDAEANGPSASPSVSADGRFVAFDSEARNLVLDGSSAPTGAYLRDTCFGAQGECAPATTRLPLSSVPPQ
jgi:hypothetical protein